MRPTRASSRIAARVHSSGHHHRCRREVPASPRRRPRAILGFENLLPPAVVALYRKATVEMNLLTS